MQTFIERYLQNELHRSNLRNVILGWMFGVTFLLLTLVTSLFLIRLNESQLVVSCASFSSYGEAVQNLPRYPKLDRNHNGIPCEKLYYGR